jgi:hypothetical protein
MDCGPSTADVDLNDNQLNIEMNKKLSKLQEEVKTQEDSDKLQKDTLGQRDSKLWRDARRNRLTASSDLIIWCLTARQQLGYLCLSESIQEVFLIKCYKIFKNEK